MIKLGDLLIQVAFIIGSTVQCSANGGQEWSGPTMCSTLNIVTTSVQ